MATADANFDRIIIERIAKLEEAVDYNRSLIVSMTEKLDTFIDEYHRNKYGEITQRGDLEARVSVLEDRWEEKGKEDRFWYAKLGVFVTAISVLVNLLSNIFGR